LTVKALPLVGLCFLGLVACAGEITYSYDSLNRLTNSVYSQGVVATYRYDAAHNVRDVKLIKDTDNDGLPDYWELLYFGSLTATDGAGDSDGDGLRDYEEYLAGTDPTDPESSMRFYGCWGGGPSGYTIVWASATNRLYTIQWTTDLMTNFVMLVTNYPGSAPQTGYFHETPVSNAFYRVLLQEEAPEEEVQP
jgi:hypothetical protein